MALQLIHVQSNVVIIPMCRYAANRPIPSINPRPVKRGNKQIDGVRQGVHNPSINPRPVKRGN